MKMGIVAVVCSAGFLIAASLALAQGKTVKACQAEWRANKAVLQPKGITEEEYVDGSLRSASCYHQASRPFEAVFGYRRITQRRKSKLWSVVLLRGCP